MSNLGPIVSLKVKNQVIQNCWEYVLANFGSFSPPNKIKVALAIISKDMPTQIQGALNVTMMPDIKLDGKPLELRIGQSFNRVTGDVVASGEVNPSNN